MTEAENLSVLKWNIHAAARTSHKCAEPMHKVKRKHLSCQQPLKLNLKADEPKKKKRTHIKTWPNWAATGFIPNLPISKQT